VVYLLVEPRGCAWGQQQSSASAVFVVPAVAVVPGAAEGPEDPPGPGAVLVVYPLILNFGTSGDLELNGVADPRG